MRKILLTFALIMLVALTAGAQSFYFDIGLGSGFGKTSIEGIDVYNLYKLAGSNVKQISLDAGVRAGVGPFGNFPLYLVGDFNGMGHRIFSGSSYIQFNSFIAGGGIILYPLPVFQFGASFGYSFTLNMDSEPGEMPNGKGFGWTLSAAWDIGNNNHGLLLGIRYFYTVNRFEYDVNYPEFNNLELNSTMLSLFLKYSFRNKVTR